MLSFHIDEVYPKAESYPLIVTFQNGYPSDKFIESECRVYDHKETHKKSIVTEINDILYTGDESDELLGKTLILARSKSTGKVRLIEVENIELKPYLKSNVDSSEAAETSHVELGRKFGSKRHKKIIEQNEKLKVDEDLVKEQMKNISHNISQDQLDLSTYNKTNSDDFYLPPINREANNVEDVYMYHNILNPEQYQTIFSELDGTDYKSNLCQYIKDIFSERWTIEQTVLAVYANTLLNLHNMIMKDLSMKKFVACPYSATLDAHVLKEFFTYNKGNRLRPPQYKDKAFAHAIVFLLLINNYKIDIQQLVKCVKLVEKTVSMKISMTGAWPIKQGDKRVAILKIPLNKTTGYLRRKSTKF